MERILKINGFETTYIISDEGYIKNKSGKILKVSNGNVQIRYNGKQSRYSLGRLVALEFLSNPKNLEYVTHIDGNKNNNKVDNLKWISSKENADNTWIKRRENNTVHVKRVNHKNIVENNTKYVFIDTDIEKQIIINDERWPYTINTQGKVKNIRNGKYINGSILHSYHYVNLRWNGKQINRAVHRLVAIAFIPNPNNYNLVDHIDGDRLNNCVENLRWVTPIENSSNKHLDKTPKKPEFKLYFIEKDFKNEIWKQYKNTKYYVSNLGRVKNINGYILSGTKSMCGYIEYNIMKKRILGHILVWETFNGQKHEGMVINHINGNKHDNRLLNLEEVTHQENMYKASVETNAWGFRKVGEFDSDGNLLREFPNASEAARSIGILPSSMRNTIRRNGKCYNNLAYRYLDIN